MRKDKKIIIGGNVPEGGCGCKPAACDDARRSLLKMAALGVAAGLSGAGSSLAQAAAQAADESARPQPGDHLVLDQSNASMKPLRVEDIEPGNPTLAYPFDKQTNTIRSGSRFNKVVLLRFEESELPEKVAANAAAGILAFSSVCTHQGCDVNAWMASDGLLACFCHGSMFDPFDGGQVVAGPAPRGLPVLPISEVDGEILVAAGFSSAPGF
ncbi:Rieske (2Fe-2S) protein [Marinobacter sp.]|uniref:QcrA and Rieske domain-containing protein n=1 Tax=Marinobacter sp. TaxID=50741 RepID=UPI0023522F62|nr:Rieske (2Fe-2S) protein [Marinobacter sp.]